MKSIFLLQWNRLRREPILFISMAGLTILFVALFGGFSTFEKIEVPTYFAESIDDSEKEVWLDRLNESDAFAFLESDHSVATKNVALGYSNYAVEIKEDQYSIFVAAEHHELFLLEQYLGQIFTEEIRIDYVAQQIGKENFREEVLSELESPPITVEKQSITDDARVGYDPRLQSLFGMTLFFVIYTIVFSLTKVAVEKRTGTWDRIILSPVKKWQMYFGYMTYSFIIGFTQISLIFLVFKYMFNFPVGDSIINLLVASACYCFAIVALGMLMMGISNTLEQLNALVPIVSVSMAMLGGAYWPIEIVSNEIILGISKVVPVTYGMDALKNIAIGSQGLVDVADTLAILVLMGVIFMGIGINLMERKA